MKRFAASDSLRPVDVAGPQTIHEPTKEDEIYPNVREHAKLLWRTILCFLLDTVFLVAWYVVQSLARGVINSVELAGIDEVTHWVFEALFAVSTLAPVLMYVVADLLKLLFFAVADTREAYHDHFDRPRL
jgi:hypothetical protein